MSDLKDALQDIQGVGEKTAESVLEVLQEQQRNPDSQLLEKAISEAKKGNDRKAAIFIRRYTRSVSNE